MAYNNIYEFVKGNAYIRNGIKVNEKKQRIVVRSASLTTTVLLWFFGLLSLAVGIYLVYRGSIVGLLAILFALVFLVGLTKRTVFDIRKKEIRQELFWIKTVYTGPESVKFHTTVVNSNGGVSYVAGLDNGVWLMKGIADFNTVENLQVFRGMVEKILLEMEGQSQQ